MSVAGYEKVKTKVIEGKKKCIYKKHKGTKLYVKGFGKMRSVESYVKLCKKAAAKSAKPAAKSKKVRSKSTRKYGGFLQEFFANIDDFSNKPGEKKENKQPQQPPVNSQEVVANQHFNNPSPQSGKMDPANMATKGGSKCDRQGGYRGGNGGFVSALNNWPKPVFPPL